ncbi:unnamed protein product [Linum trigynum]|uniref:Uncharacterized protein n=1 Tax=Linum trigynum TaxID=586398 RepID=A0AAV2FSU9_9ROSI
MIEIAAEMIEIPSSAPPQPTGLAPPQSDWPSSPPIFLSLSLTRFAVTEMGRMVYGETEGVFERPLRIWATDLFWRGEAAAIAGAWEANREGKRRPFLSREFTSSQFHRDELVHIKEQHADDIELLVAGGRGGLIQLGIEEDND